MESINNQSPDLKQKYGPILKTIENRPDYQRIPAENRLKAHASHLPASWIGLSFYPGFWSQLFAVDNIPIIGIFEL